MGLKKQIIQFKDGEQVAVYNSATEAASAVGSTKSNISKCCNGILKQVNGFTFKYTGEHANKRVNDGEFKCPYCDSRFETYDGLCKHIFKYRVHGDITTREELLAYVKYNGIRPTCKCGCGEYTGISYVGGAHFVNYITGHSSRIHNNWGHNNEAKKRSADTRRKQYASGERIQWNKGRTWNETYSDEEIKELMKQYLDKERNIKISKSLSGVPKTKEHIMKLKKIFNTEKYRELHRKRMKERLLSGQFSLSSEVEKKFIKECVEPLGIEYDTQYYIKDIHHYCDVYVPSKNIVIEFQGDYWHGNPKKYLKEELSSFQLEKVKKDEILREYCKNNGMKLIEIWESDYNMNQDSVKNLIKTELSDN